MLSDIQKCLPYIGEMSDFELEALHEEISDELLRQKLFYYYPEYGVCISDELYDLLEKTYLWIGQSYQLDTSITHIVGFPLSTPLGKRIVESL